MDEDKLMHHRMLWLLAITAVLIFAEADPILGYVSCLSIFEINRRCVKAQHSRMYNKPSFADKVKGAIYPWNIFPFIIGYYWWSV